MVGVSDKGVEVGRDTIEKITNKIVQITDPKMYPKTSVKEVNDNKIIVIGMQFTGNSKEIYKQDLFHIMAC